MFKTYETVRIAKAEYERYKKWSQGITLKEFKEEVEKLGLTVEDDKYSLGWCIKFNGCIVAKIDPINECTIRTSNLFYKLNFKYELFELLTNLAFTCKEDRHIEDYFEKWQYEE